MKAIPLLLLMTSLAVAKPGTDHRPATNAPPSGASDTNSLTARHAAATERAKLYYEISKDPVEDTVTIKSIAPIIFEGGVELHLHSITYAAALEPTYVRLRFQSHSREWRFSVDDRLATKVDGLRKSYGVYYDGSISEAGNTHEFVSVSVDLADWIKMVRAKEVLFNLGDYLRAAEIKAADRETWKVLLDYYIVDVEARKPKPARKTKKK